MRAFIPRVVFASAAMLASAGAAAALEGEFTPETRDKLAVRITVHEEHASLGKLLGGIAEQSGLSFVLPHDVARMPEEVAIAANNATAEELIETIAFVLHLEYTATPNGVIAFRLREGDPRREAVLGRYRPPKQKGGEGGPPPKLPPKEVIERVSHDPKIRELLERTGARLFPGKFVHEKRVWVLHVRREDEKRPVAAVFASEDGEVVGIKEAGDEDKWKQEKRNKEKRKQETTVRAIRSSGGRSSSRAMAAHLTTEVTEDTENGYGQGNDL